MMSVKGLLITKEITLTNPKSELWWTMINETVFLVLHYILIYHTEYQNMIKYLK